MYCGGEITGYRFSILTITMVTIADREKVNTYTQQNSETDLVTGHPSQFYDVTLEPVTTHLAGHRTYGLLQITMKKVLAYRLNVQIGNIKGFSEKSADLFIPDWLTGTHVHRI